MARPPASMPPGNRPSESARREYESANGALGALFDGYDEKRDRKERKKEARRNLRFGPYPREWYVTRQCKEGPRQIKLSRGKDGKFSKPRSTASL